MSYCRWVFANSLPLVSCLSARHYHHPPESREKKCRQWRKLICVVWSSEVVERKRRGREYDNGGQGAEEKEEAVSTDHNCKQESDWSCSVSCSRQGRDSLFVLLISVLWSEPLRASKINIVNSRWALIVLRVCGMTQDDPPGTKKQIEDERQVLNANRLRVGSAWWSQSFHCSLLPGEPPWVPEVEMMQMGLCPSCMLFVCWPFACIKSIRLCKSWESQFPYRQNVFECSEYIVCLCCRKEWNDRFLSKDKQSHSFCRQSSY